jgi:hypothetical protein
MPGPIRHGLRSGSGLTIRSDLRARRRRRYVLVAAPIDGSRARVDGPLRLRWSVLREDRLIPSSAASLPRMCDHGRSSTRLTSEAVVSVASRLLRTYCVRRSTASRGDCFERSTHRSLPPASGRYGSTSIFPSTRWASRLTPCLRPFPRFGIRAMPCGRHAMD